MMNLFENVFMVTKTCQNGNEKTFKISVYSKRFKDGVFYSEPRRIEDAVAYLKACHFYNIRFVCSKPVTRHVI